MASPLRPFRFRSAAASLRGRSHAENQDAWCIVASPRSRANGTLVAVADGVSSVPRGQWAAQHACRRLTGVIREARSIRVEELAQVVNELDWELREHGQGSAACTLSLAWLARDEAALLHVGDSAIFLVREGKVRQLSVDMSSGSRLKGFLGMGPAVAERLQILRLPLQDQDGLLLITDGVRGVLRHTELAGWWLRTGRDPDRTVRGVVREVHRREGGDDATVLAVAIDEVGSD